jgi:hypothetical protein
MILIISFSLLLIGGRKTNKTGFIGLIQIILVGYLILCWVSLGQSNLRWLQVQVLQNIGFFQVIDLDSELELESDSRICLISDKLSTL